jgi:hypothetical protein
MNFYFNSKNILNFFYIFGITYFIISNLNIFPSLPSKTENLNHNYPLVEFVYSYSPSDNSIMEVN